MEAMNPFDVSVYTRRPTLDLNRKPTPAPITDAETRAAQMFRAGHLPCSRSLEILHNPRFGKQQTIQDWRNFIPDSMRAIWQELSPDARAAAYFLAVSYGEGWQGEDDE